MMAARPEGNKKPARDEERLSTAEAAKRLGLHPVTVRAWARTGAIPAVIDQGGYRVRLSDIPAARVEHALGHGRHSGGEGSTAELLARISALEAEIREKDALIAKLAAKLL